jgi:hypothetical protein
MSTTLELSLRSLEATLARLTVAVEQIAAILDERATDRAEQAPGERPRGKRDAR